MDKKLDPPAPPSVADAQIDAPPVTKTYASERVINFRNIAIFATALAVLFQTSYLYSISPVLLSYMTLTDTSLKTGILLPFTTTFLLFVVEFIEDFENRLEVGRPFEGSKAHARTKVFSYIAAILIAILVAWVLYQVYVKEHQIGEYSSWGKSALAAIGLVVGLKLLTRYLWQVAEIRHDAETNGLVSSKTLTNVLLISALGASTLGTIAGLTRNGTACEITTGDSVYDARFLISLDSVTVLKVSGQTIIINSSMIEQMNCTWRPRSKEENTSPSSSLQKS